MRKLHDMARDIATPTVSILAVSTDGTRSDLRSCCCLLKQTQRTLVMFRLIIGDAEYEFYLYQLAYWGLRGPQRVH